MRGMPRSRYLRGVALRSRSSARPSTSSSRNPPDARCSPPPDRACAAEPSPRRSMPGDGSRQNFSLSPHCSRQVARRASVKVLGFETLWSGCCGIDPGSAVFSQCGADLHLVECADRVRRLTAQKVLLTAQKVAVQSKVDVG